VFGQWAPPVLTPLASRRTHRGQSALPSWPSRADDDHANALLATKTQRSRQHTPPTTTNKTQKKGWDPLNPSDGYDAAAGREVNGKTVAAFLAPYRSNNMFKASDQVCGCVVCGCVWERVVRREGAWGLGVWVLFALPWCGA
jgi:hypothetical protein